MKDELQFFMKLSRKQQTDFVRNFGSFIGQAIKGDLFAYLYCVGPFYAELYYNSTSLQPVKVIAFDDEELLTPYLTWIDISEIL